MKKTVQRFRLFSALRRLDVMTLFVCTYAFYSISPHVCTAEETLVRLVNGSGPHEGRVEVFHERRWGTVCDDAWDKKDGDVVCRMLGYREAVGVHVTGRFGRGTNMRTGPDGTKLFIQIVLFPFPLSCYSGLVFSGRWRFRSCKWCSVTYPPLGLLDKQCFFSFVLGCKTFFLFFLHHSLLFFFTWRSETEADFQFFRWISGAAASLSEEPSHSGSKLGWWNRSESFQT